MSGRADVLCALAETTDRENYCKPEVNDKEIIKIEARRHPVVEKMLSKASLFQTILILTWMKIDCPLLQGLIWPVNPPI